MLKKRILSLGIVQNRLYKNAYHRAWYKMIGLVIKEIRVCFRQFYTLRYPVRSFFRCLGVIYSVLTRIILGRNTQFSFGHFGEDRILEGLLKPLITQNGFYVEVGCNHPVFLSNTYGLYRKGWRGICVDANNTHIQRFSRMRPKDIAVKALVSDRETDRLFYHIQNDVLSTTDTQNKQAYEQDGLAVSEELMHTRTLTQILDQYQAPNFFDLLMVDVEEHDREVLIGLDWDKYRPKLVVVEDETFDINKPTENRIFQLLTVNGYRLEGFVLKNLYFQLRIDND